MNNRLQSGLPPFEEANADSMQEGVEPVCNPRNVSVENRLHSGFAAHREKDHLLRTALWLHDEGYCVLPRSHSHQPSVPMGQYCRQRPDRRRLASWISKPKCSGIGVLVGPVSNLAVLDMDSFSSVALLHDWMGDRFPGSALWHRTDRGIRIWFSGVGAPTHVKVLSRDGVDLYLDRHFCECPPLRMARAFNGPIQPSSTLPPLPVRLIEWLMSGERSTESPLENRCHTIPRDHTQLAAYFWSDPRAPIPKGHRCSLLYRVAGFYLARTNHPYRLISELVRRATRIDGLTEEQAITCCDDAMRRIRGTSARTTEVSDRVSRHPAYCNEAYS